MPELDLISNLSSPDFDAPPDIQADWLELAAFLSANGRSRLDDLVGQQDLEWNQELADFGETDQVLEDIAANVIAEIERRKYDLEDAYPFYMTEDGSSLVLTQKWSPGNTVYLFCLVIAHAVRSELVSLDLTPDEPSLRLARDVFQICATLAAAGHCGGPSYSIGWPRPDKTGFLEKLKQVWAHFGDGSPHEVPLPGTPDQIKDEGIDVIAWWPERDKQPGQGFLVGQVASGHDWKDKSIRPHLERFLNEWFRVQPVSLAHPTIFIPFTVQEDQMRRTSSMHGYVLHRGRLPRFAARAPALVEQGVAPIERIEEIHTIEGWLRDHLAALKQRGHA